MAREPWNLDCRLLSVQPAQPGTVSQWAQPQESRGPGIVGSTQSNQAGRPSFYNSATLRDASKAKHADQNAESTNPDPKTPRVREGAAKTQVGQL